MALSVGALTLLLWRGVGGTDGVGGVGSFHFGDVFGDDP